MKPLKNIPGVDVPVLGSMYLVRLFYDVLNHPDSRAFLEIPSRVHLILVVAVSMEGWPAVGLGTMSWGGNVLFAGNGAKK